MGRKTKNKAEYSSDGKTLIRCPLTYEGIFEIPSGVLTISEKAFFGCQLLTGVKIPNSMEQISNSAFMECSELSFIEFEKGSRVAVIGESAFSGCRKLEKIEIPEGITEIKPRTFQECTYLEDVVIPDGVVGIADEAFCRCTNLKTVTIPNTVTVIGKDAFCSCASLMEISIPDSVERIDTGAFNSCASLTRVSFGSESHLKHIRKNAFVNCYRLVSINIPGSLEFIATRAFMGCDSLKSLFIPSCVDQMEPEIAALCNMDFVFYLESEPNINWPPEWNHMGGHTSPPLEDSIASVQYHTPRWWYEKFVTPKAINQNLIRTSSLDDDYAREKMKEFILETDKVLYLRSGWEWRGTGREEVTKERMMEVIDSIGDAKQQENRHMEIIEYDDAVLANVYIHNPF